MIVEDRTAFFDADGKCIAIHTGGEIDDSEFAFYAPAPLGTNPNNYRWNLTSGEPETFEPDVP